MKLNGRWFPQIVDRDSGNLYPIYRVCPNRRAMRECRHWGAPLFISDVAVLNNSREYGNIHVGLFTPVLEMHCVHLRTSR